MKWSLWHILSRLHTHLFRSYIIKNLTLTCLVVSEKECAFSHSLWGLITIIRTRPCSSDGISSADSLKKLMIHFEGEYHLKKNKKIVSLFDVNSSNISAALVDNSRICEPWKFMQQEVLHCQWLCKTSLMTDSRDLFFNRLKGVYSLTKSYGLIHSYLNTPPPFPLWRPMYIQH